jgi:hypothetical protein
VGQEVQVTGVVPGRGLTQTSDMNFLLESSSSTPMTKLFLVNPKLAFAK